MSDRDTQNRLRQLEERQLLMERTLGRQPVRRPVGGGGTLPSGTGRYKVLMLVDDLDPATADWDYIRFGSGE